MADIPRTMTAIEIAEPGAPQVLRAVQRPVPAVGPGEVLIRVVAAGVNRPDVMQTNRPLRAAAGNHGHPGPRGRGRSRRLWRGRQVSRRQWASGLRAAGRRGLCRVRRRAGGAMPADSRIGSACTRQPRCPETFFTVYHNVFERARLRAGETLLVHGGSSGIGTTAIRLAKAFGLASSSPPAAPDKCEACVALGAERAINYRSEDFVAAVKEATAGRGADVILDMVGAAYLAAKHRGSGGRGPNRAHRDARRSRGAARPASSVPEAPAPDGFHAAPAVRRAARVGSRRRCGHDVWPKFATHDLLPPIHARFPARRCVACPRADGIERAHRQDPARRRLSGCCRLEVSRGPQCLKPRPQETAVCTAQAPPPVSIIAVGDRVRGVFSARHLRLHFAPSIRSGDRGL